MRLKGSECKKKYSRIDSKAKPQGIALRSKDSLESRKTKLTVSAPEECSWCIFGPANSEERLASGHTSSRKSSTPLRTKTYSHVAIQDYSDT